MQNAAARLVLGIPRCEHITPGLKSLHWLPDEKRDCTGRSGKSTYGGGGGGAWAA